MKVENGDIIDLTKFIVSGTVNRVLNEVSTAELEIRNPGKQFTVAGNPTFRPMDPITIFLSRFPDRVIQVFTGYLDTTPYLQLFPGTCTLKASCTLKRLMYTYFDAGLPYTWDFLKSHGWVVDIQSGEVFNPAEFTGGEPTRDNESGEAKEQPRSHITDGSLGELIAATLIEIGRWHPGSVRVESLPQSIIKEVTTLAKDFNQDDEQARAQLEDLLSSFVGEYSGGAGFTASADGAVATSPGEAGWVKVGATVDNTSGQAPTYSDHNGMSFAELMVTPDVAGVPYAPDEALSAVLGIPQGDYGMAMGTAILIRNVGGDKAYKIWKNDNGGGQLGELNYKIDLHCGIATKLGVDCNTYKGEVEVKRIESSQGPGANDPGHNAAP